MAKVIGFDESKKYKKTCLGDQNRPGCTAVVEYDWRDIKSSGNQEGYEYLICPNCQRQIWLRSFG